ncbi:MAG: tRNA lysidine(34) synthetase TilS [Bacteroidetes bacterium]|nr:MAG: tRNA lysidine(34) synthetase TilS [Bacteroidota bacterium]
MFLWLGENKAMDNLFGRFTAFIEENSLFTQKDKILLAVSGGVDSVVMAHLFKRAGYDAAIAHCNFMLRGAESDIDEDFCRQLGKKLDLPFLSVSFNTRKIAKQRSISIQMAARELRYEWFEEVCVMLGYDCVATAHHMNDSVETFFVNLIRGCGIRGLHGIPVKNANRVRPLLFATRKEIEEYAAIYQIKFRFDASNEETKYLRNKIRHELVPKLKEINPLSEKSVFSTTKRIREAEQLFDFAIDQFRNKILASSGKKSVLNLIELKAAPGTATLLFELLKDKGLHADQAQMILEANTGAVFRSTTHRFLVDRDNLVVEPVPDGHNATEFSIEMGENLIVFDQGEVQIERKEDTTDKFPSTSYQVFVDESELIFPLTIRSWNPGDAFQPLGMKGKTKKLKDYFTDSKLSLFEKEKVRILVNNDGKIIWVMGHRLDDRFKIAPTTRSYLEFTFESK